MRSVRRQAFLATAASAMVFAVADPVPHAWANGFDLGGAANYEILFEGNGGNTLQFNNSVTAGNVGIGGSGTFQGTSGLITGAVQFSGAPGKYNNTGALVLGGVGYNNVAVSSALATVNALSQSLGQEAGKAVSITSGGSVNAASGTQDAKGNYVFTVNTLNFPNGTFTINGTANQKVVFNVATPSAISTFNGQILLAGGITSSNVLFNIIPSSSYSQDYTSLSGGPTLSINTNGGITFGDFLDPTGAIQITKSILDGSVFGGDSVNMAIMSDVTFNFSGVHAAPGPTIGAGLPGLVTAVGLLALWRHRRRSPC
jgi:hypothetical protein